MRRTVSILLMTALLVGTLAMSALATPDKVYVCHTTGSEHNPTVVVEVSERSWTNGHSRSGHHEGSDAIGDWPKGPTFKTANTTCDGGGGGGGAEG